MWIDGSDDEILSRPVAGANQLEDVHHRDAGLLEMAPDATDGLGRAVEIEEMWEHDGVDQDTPSSRRSDQRIELRGVVPPDVRVAVRGVDPLAVAPAGLGHSDPRDAPVDEVGEARGVDDRRQPGGPDTQVEVDHAPVALGRALDVVQVVGDDQDARRDGVALECVSLLGVCSNPDGRRRTT